MEVRLEPGAPLPAVLRPDGKVRFRGHAKRQGNDWNIGFGLTDGEGHGVSVYRGGKRLEVRWVAFDGEGKPMASGLMTYG